MQTVSDVMTRGVRTLSPTDTLTAAAQAMQELDVGSIPVCDGVRLVGMVTDRDIVVRGVAQERVNVSLQDVMSEGLLYCHEDDTVPSAMESMRRQQVRRLPVVDKDKRLVGIVTLGDVATKGDEDDAGDALRGISEPSEPHRSRLSAASATAGGGQTA
ncbi:MAG: CBS domain-containing protein [Gammaproteobacteria bacterium]|nr:CBS domain-containing protein [Gammaproteobacteria bacterium]MBU1350970.1 CBS domain-containing protein [Gammaproteobacteria bacterium]MBU1504746.1 CBS domain-containing protein [Gammaproteobacteria bacterium]MBU2122543.1 CBS domain-containing protein [Gammaproteobacteria bacterium]MBU2171496.1 CBS domain-containing protein [Gammaproteobacteria bacterium]